MDDTAIETMFQEMRKCIEDQDAEIERLRCELKKRQTHCGWPIPCPSSGDQKACEMCVTATSDASPYCWGLEYKTKLAALRKGSVIKADTRDK